MNFIRIQDWDVKDTSFDSHAKYEGGGSRKCATCYGTEIEVKIAFDSQMKNCFSLRQHLQPQWAGCRPDSRKTFTVITYLNKTHTKQQLLLPRWWTVLPVAQRSDNKSTINWCDYSAAHLKVLCHYIRVYTGRCVAFTLQVHRRLVAFQLWAIGLFNSNILSLIPNAFHPYCMGDMRVIVSLFYKWGTFNSSDSFWIKYTALMPGLNKKQKNTTLTIHFSRVGGG